MKHFCLAALLALGTAHAADIQKINGSVKVNAGSRVDNVSTVNGSVRIGRDAAANDVETVNGSVLLEANASVRSVENVNGSITLEEAARVARDVESVNGSIRLERQADVTGRLSNVNGRIELTGAHVGGGIVTSTGDILLEGDSRVENGILVEEQRSGVRFGKDPVPRIVIGPGAVVEGTLRFEREVRLFVSDRARIGPVEGVSPLSFSGNNPPE